MFSGTHGEGANQNLCYLFSILSSDDKIERRQRVVKDNGGTITEFDLPSRTSRSWPASTPGEAQL